MACLQSAKRADYITSNYCCHLDFANDRCVALAGIQGHSIYIDDSGDAEANYTVLSLIEDSAPDRAAGGGGVGGNSTPVLALLPVGDFTTEGSSTIPVCYVYSKLQFFS